MTGSGEATGSASRSSRRSAWRALAYSRAHSMHFDCSLFGCRTFPSEWNAVLGRVRRHIEHRLVPPREPASCSARAHPHDRREPSRSFAACAMHVWPQSQAHTYDAGPMLRAGSTTSSRPKRSPTRLTALALTLSPSSRPRAPSGSRGRRGTQGASSAAVRHTCERKAARSSPRTRTRRRARARRRAARPRASRQRALAPARPGGAAQRATDVRGRRPMRARQRSRCRRRARGRRAPFARGRGARRSDVGPSRPRPSSRA